MKTRSEAIFDSLIKNDTSFKRPQRTYGRHHNRRVSFMPQARHNFEALIKERNLDFTFSDEDVPREQVLRRSNPRRRCRSPFSPSSDDDFVAPKKRAKKRKAVINRKEEESADAFHWTEIEGIDLVVEKPKDRSAVPVRKIGLTPPGHQSLESWSSSILISTPCREMPRQPLELMNLLAQNNFLRSPLQASPAQILLPPLRKYLKSSSSRVSPSHTSRDLKQIHGLTSSPRVVLTPINTFSHLKTSSEKTASDSKLKLLAGLVGSPRVALTPLDTNKHSHRKTSAEKTTSNSKLKLLAGLASSPRVALTPLDTNKHSHRKTSAEKTARNSKLKLLAGLASSPRVALTPLDTNKHSHRKTSSEKTASDSKLKINAKSPRIAHTPLKKLSSISAAHLSKESKLRRSSLFVKSPGIPRPQSSLCRSQDLFPSLSLEEELVGDVSILDIEEPQEHILTLCQQDDIDNFSNFLSNQELAKIGEGVYGEVFITRDSDVYKVVPVNGSTVINAETQKTFAEVLPEALISRELSKLSAKIKHQTSSFIQLRSLHCLHGKYPRKFLQAWDLFHKEKKSLNDRPSILPRNQVYLVFGFEHGGRALDSITLRSGLQAVSIWSQVACALAVAERALQFEHRDLHTGNILVSEVKTGSEVQYCLDGVPFTVRSRGVQVSIIDFTMARLTRGGLTFFLDISNDESLFTGKGDYQFDIYRKMRKHNGNCWEHFAPYTNVLWLHYLAYQLLHKTNYCGGRKKHHFSELKGWCRQILSYKSAEQFVLEHFVPL